MIDPKKYGTASEVSGAVGVARTTLINAANRGEIASRRTCLPTVEMCHSWWLTEVS